MRARGAAPGKSQGNRVFAVAPWLLLAGAAWAAGPAAEQELTDPTRPADVRDSVAAGAPQGPVLQSVLISPVRRVAVIDGQTVPLGGRFGAATLVAVTETEVVLKEGNARRHLRLLPAVEKGAAAQSRGGKQKDKP
ncbi:MAG TPA: MSHA biogenesis protein MshK [Burkholderiales bacterium]